MTGVQRLVRAGGLCAGVLLLAACAPERGHLPGADFGAPVGTRDPDVLVSLLSSNNTPEPSRQSADKLLAEIRGPRDETRLAVLEQLLFAPAQSDTMRLYAMDQLAAADPARAGRALSLYLPRMNGAVLEHACTLAGNLQDPRLAGALVRSLDRVTSDPLVPRAEIDARPEWSALPKVTGLPGPAALLELLTVSPQTDVRIAALDAIERTAKDPLATVGAIRPAGSDSFLSDVRAWAAAWGTLPLGRSECQWVSLLRRPENAALLARALERHKLLAGQADYAASPVFVQALAYCSDAAARAPRAELLAGISRRLEALPHLRREAAYPDSPADNPQTLAANEKRLTRGDLLTLSLLLDGLASESALAELQRQGLEDLSDTATEHGGLLSVQNLAAPALVFSPAAPMYQGSDVEYATDDKLLQQAPLGLALYHFHFQQIRNAERAGPGEGDMAFARTQHCNCVVITSTGPREMNIDYYTARGAVVDLGVYRAK